jgi:hypothetical protein
MLRARVGARVIVPARGSPESRRGEVIHPDRGAGLPKIPAAARSARAKRRRYGRCDDIAGADARTAVGRRRKGRTSREVGGTGPGDYR